MTLGTIILGGCSDADLPKDRYVYQSHPECVADWGEKNCEQASSSGSSHGGGGGGGGRSYGPRFNSVVETPSGKHIWSGNPDTPAIHPNTGQPMRGAINVSRGGFGASARSFFSGGS